MIIEVNDAGEILVPAELVQAPPHTRVEAGREGNILVLKPAAQSIAPLDFVRSLMSIEGRLTMPSTTFRREDIYGDDGR